MYKSLFLFLKTISKDNYKVIFLPVSVSNIAFCGFATAFRTGAGSHGETGRNKQYED